MDKAQWDRLQQKIQMEDEARDFLLLVDALRGLSDRQVCTLSFHFHNIHLPDGEKDVEADTKFFDALQAARALDRETRNG